MHQQNVNQPPPIVGNQDKVIVDAKDFGAKFSSKKECYRFLSHDCGVYLPAYQTITIWALRDLISGERTRISQTDVQYINVPNFEGLKIETFLQFAAGRPDVMRAFPMLERERVALPRGYIANVIYTKVGEPFKEWVDGIVNQRHEERRQDQSTIKMDPEIAAIFNQSTATSGKFQSLRLSISCSSILF